MKRFTIFIIFCVLIFDIYSINAENLNVSLINTEVISNKKVIITWQKVSDSTVSYNIYRSLSVLDSPDKIQKAKLLATLPANKEKFIDDTISESGEYFYGIAVVKNGVTNKNLIEDASYSSEPVEIKIEKKEPVKTIVINKQIPEENIEPVIPKPEKVEKPKKIIKPVKIVKRKKKKRVKKSKRINYNLILKKGISYFFNKNYKNAEKKFKYLINSKADKAVKNKAKLFLGKTYYYEGRYRKAIIYFAKVKNYYPEETDFWINRSLNKIGE